jgi:hypothetical protein
MRSVLSMRTMLMPDCFMSVRKRKGSDELLATCAIRPVSRI